VHVETCHVIAILLLLTLQLQQCEEASETGISAVHSGESHGEPPMALESENDLGRKLGP